MLEFSNRKSEQIRPPSGDAFWPFQAEIFATSVLDENFGLLKVPWREREWVCKEEERTIYEVVAYQIASAIGLPTQPWLAFERSGRLATGAGMLIELLPSAIGPIYLFDSHALGPAQGAILARAMAMCVFKRPGGEWPEWFWSKDKTDLRLLDLDGICPFLSWPRLQIGIRYYRQDTRAAYAEMQDRSVQLEIRSAFDAELDRLLELDFSRVLDLSGHPQAAILTRTILRGLRTRQREVTRLKQSGYPPSS